MSDVEQLLLILGGIYLSECLVWVRLGAVLVASAAGWRYAVRHPLWLAGRGVGGLCPVSVLPFGAAVIGEQWPCSVSPQGVSAGVTQTINPSGPPTATHDRYVAFDQIASVQAANKDLLINHTLFVQAATRGMARGLASLLKRLKDAQEANREAIIEEALNQATNAPALRRRWRDARASLIGLRVACAALFSEVFIALPAAYRWLALEDYAWWWVLGFAATLGTVIGLYRRLHRRLYPHDRHERRWQSLLMVVAPTVAMRAAHSMTREIAAGYHALTVVEALCPPAVFRGLARQVLLDAHHPIGSDSATHDPQTQQAQQWFHARLCASLERFVTDRGYNLPQLLAPPTADSAAAKAYCARCGSQFTSTDARCVSCGGRAVVAFDGA